MSSLRIKVNDSTFAGILAYASLNGIETIITPGEPKEILYLLQDDWTDAIAWLAHACPTATTEVLG